MHTKDVPIKPVVGWSPFTSLSSVTRHCRLLVSPQFRQDMIKLVHSRERLQATPPPFPVTPLRLRTPPPSGLGEAKDNQCKPIQPRQESKTSMARVDKEISRKSPTSKPPFLLIKHLCSLPTKTMKITGHLYSSRNGMPTCLNFQLRGHDFDKQTAHFYHETRNFSNKSTPRISLGRSAALEDKATTHAKGLFTRCQSFAFCCVVQMA